MMAGVLAMEGAERGVAMIPIHTVLQLLLSTHNCLHTKMEWPIS